MGGSHQPSPQESFVIGDRNAQADEQSGESGTPRHNSSGVPREMGGSHQQSPQGYLKAWVSENLSNPYPTKEQKMIFVKETGWTIKQINNWFHHYRNTRMSTKKFEMWLADRTDQSPGFVVLKGWLAEKMSKPDILVGYLSVILIFKKGVWYFH